MASVSEEIPESYSLRPVTYHITTHDKDNKATIFSSVQPVPVPVGPKTNFNYVYCTTQPRPNLSTEADIEYVASISSTRAALRLVQPNGTTCRVIDIAPESEPHQHRTQSLDYVVMVAGELELIMEDGATRRCGVGDVVVQRGTRHAWKNASKTEWARMFAVMIESEKVELGSELMHEDLGIEKKQGTASAAPSAIQQALQYLWVMIRCIC